MEPPTPPRDLSLRNIIDKLAEFVARNGPEFEAITKQKQSGNKKFEFLFGGEFYSYYQYRVQSEQNFLNQQQSNSMTLQSAQQQQNPAQMQQHFNQPPPSQSSQMSFPPPSITGSVIPTNQQISSGLNLHHPIPGTIAIMTGLNQPPWNNQQVNANSQQASNLTAQIESINMQQNQLREQIRQSEQNLSAQHSALRQQQQKQVDEAITKAQNDALLKQAEENNINLMEFDGILQPIIDSCTKDSISAGKNWILQHTSEPSKTNVVLQYLLKKALLNGSSFQQKLHLIYLVNDVLHHCARKNANDLKTNLENVVIPMFCSADIIATEEQKKKLTKLLTLWESKAKFFDACVISKLESPNSSMQEYKTNLMNIHNDVVNQFTKSTHDTLENYQKQHQMFIQHATQQIAALETQKQKIEQQMLTKVLPQNAGLIMPQQQQQQQQQSQYLIDNNQYNNNIPQQLLMNQGPQQPPHLQVLPSLMSLTSHQDALALQQKAETVDSFGAFLESKQKLAIVATASNRHQMDDQYQNPPQQKQQIPALCAYPQRMISINNNGPNAYPAPPPNFAMLPDLSKPPPGFNSPFQSDSFQGSSDEQQLSQPAHQEIRPKAAYYDLPAGLMVPLIRLEDYNYKPLDPRDIRLPPPAPQNERLTSALTAFYSLPSHDRPRDAEGWEKLGLYEYYKVKNAAKKQKEEEIKDGTREKTKSPSPIYIEQTKPKRNNKRRYRSKSRSKSRSVSRSKSKSPRRRSRSPLPERNSGGRNRNSSKTKMSPKRSPIRDRDNHERRDRDKKERIREKSLSPPSFYNANYSKHTEFIEETNKGHQMLMKMGWGGSGTGLGSKNQGIDAPISGGEVRDRKDMYKGVGVNLNDPFENFRKNKGAAFIHRMRMRDDKS